MRVSELKGLLRHLPGRTEILIIPNGQTETGVKLSIGLGYFDEEEKEMVYLGKVTIAEDIDEH